MILTWMRDRYGSVLQWTATKFYLTLYWISCWCSSWFFVEWVWGNWPGLHWGEETTAWVGGAIQNSGGGIPADHGGAPRGTGEAGGGRAGDGADGEGCHHHPGLLAILQSAQGTQSPQKEGWWQKEKVKLCVMSLTVCVRWLYHCSMCFIDVKTHFLINI